MKSENVEEGYALLKERTHLHSLLPKVNTIDGFCQYEYSEMVSVTFNSLNNPDIISQADYDLLEVAQLAMLQHLQDEIAKLETKLDQLGIEYE